MTQRYTGETQRLRMSLGNCPECGGEPGDHLDDNRFWLPRECDLMPRGVEDRIAQYRADAEVSR